MGVLLENRGKKGCSIGTARTQVDFIYRTEHYTPHGFHFCLSVCASFVLWSTLICNRFTRDYKTVQIVLSINNIEFYYVPNKNFVFDLFTSFCLLFNLPHILIAESICIGFVKKTVLVLLHKLIGTRL